MTLFSVPLLKYLKKASLKRLFDSRLVQFEIIYDLGVFNHPDFILRCDV